MAQAEGVIRNRPSLTNIKEAAAARAASLPVSNDFAPCWAEQRTGARTDRADLCETCARTAGLTEQLCEQVASILAIFFNNLQLRRGTVHVATLVEVIVSYLAISSFQLASWNIVTKHAAYPNRNFFRSAQVGQLRPGSCTKNISCLGDKCPIYSSNC